MMKYFQLIVFLFLVGACSEPRHNVIPLPNDICSLTLDSISVDSDVILNPTGIVATSDYLIVSNLMRDTIFDVFDRTNMNHLYSDLIYGQGTNDMLPFRWIRYLKDNDFYVVGLGVPILTEIEVNGSLEIKQRKIIELEKDICQNIYPLSNNKVLVQLGKRRGEWSIYDIEANEMTDMPEFPFKEAEKEDDMFTMFQNRAVHVAVNAENGRIAFFNVMFPHVRFFDSNGNVLCESNVGDQIMDASRYFRERHMYYTGCVVSGDFIFTKYSPKEKTSDFTYFQIWDWNGCLLGTFTIEGRMKLFTISPDAKMLYTVKVDNDNIFFCSLEPILKELNNNNY